jgi:hypothetical protein
MKRLDDEIYSQSIEKIKVRNEKPSGRQSLPDGYSDGSGISAVSFAGADAEQWVERAETEQAGRQRNDADIRPDRAAHNGPGYQSQACDNTKNTVDTTNVCFHD